MKNLIQYSSKISNLFFDFLAEKIDKDELIKELYLLEQYHRDLIQDKNEEHCICFQFVDGCMMTTIADLNLDLKFGGKNGEYIKQQMKTSIALMGNLQIFYY